MSILDRPPVSGRYLFPQPRRVRNPFWVAVDGADLACHQRIVDAEAFTVVHFHGNGEVVADYVPDVADQFEELGLNSLFVEYREYGESTGEAQLVSMLGDGEAAVEAAGIPFPKAVAFGRSIGSLYAIELANRHHDLAGLIIESGIANPAERFLAYADLAAEGIREHEVQAEVKQYFDHKQKMSDYPGPLLTLHTEHDGLVDISHAERLHQWAATSRKRLLRFPHGDHNSICAVNQAEYFQAVAGFVEQLGGQ